MSKQGVIYRFLDGPLADREVTLERGLERLDIGGKGVAALWTYEWAGHEGGITLLAKRRSQREVRRLVMRYIGKRSKHPAIMAQSWRQYPKTGQTVKTGQGARRRAEKRVNA